MIPLHGHRRTEACAKYFIFELQQPYSAEEPAEMVFKAKIPQKNFLLRDFIFNDGVA